MSYVSKGVIRALDSMPAIFTVAAFLSGYSCYGRFSDNKFRSEKCGEAARLVMTNIFLKETK